MTRRNQLIIWFLIWMAFAMLLFKSVVTAVAWWEDPGSVSGFDWFWVLALPVLVGFYLRYFSILSGRCVNNACDSHDTR
ncbi:hypothetical protein HUS23_08575 [Ectothiorhodospiraceae bacterium 2226]|nr:hypothetical protein HUS23_08575 [Ectothiorhodospiraceae bacterium 2226]